MAGKKKGRSPKKGTKGSSNTASSGGEAGRADPMADVEGGAAGLDRTSIDENAEKGEKGVTSDAEGDTATRAEEQQNKPAGKAMAGIAGSIEHSQTSQEVELKQPASDTDRGNQTPSDEQQQKRAGDDSKGSGTPVEEQQSETAANEEHKEGEGDATPEEEGKKVDGPTGEEVHGATAGEAEQAAQDRNSNENEGENPTVSGDGVDDLQDNRGDGRESVESGSDGRQQTERERASQLFDNLFKRETYPINPTWLPLLSICRIQKRTKALQAFGAKINHNILLPDVMADISNNATGNKAKIYQAPVPKLDNDLPHLLLMNLASKEVADEDCVLPIKSIIAQGADVSGGTEEADKEWVSELFKDETSDGKNVYIEWFEKNHEMLQKNVARDENQEEVAEFFGCLADFKASVEIAERKLACETSALQKYRLLVREIHRSRTKAISKGTQPKGWLNVIHGMIEGNNRGWALIHLLFNAKLDEKAGMIKENSLTAESLIPHLSEFPDRNAEDVARNLRNAQGTIGEWIEEKVMENDSFFSRETKFEVYFPVTKREFKKTGITIEDVQQVMIHQSHALMLNKKQCADMPIRNTMANLLFQVIGEIEKNEKEYPSDHYPTFSANGGDYIESEPINKTIKQPKINGKSDPTWTKPCVKVCELWEKAEYRDLEADPNLAKLQKFLRAVPVSTVVFQGKEIKATNDKCHGPFTLNANTMFKSNGEIFLANEKGGGAKKKKKNDDDTDEGGAKTESMKWKKEGRQHLPLAVEEFNLGVFLTMLGPSVYQAQKGIAPEKWQTHAERKTCREHVRYLVQTNIHTAAAGTVFGQRLESQYKAKSFGNIVGIGSVITEESNVHLCAMLFLANALNACLSLGRTQGIKKAREFISMIAMNRYDTDLTDKEFMDILGALYPKIHLHVELQVDKMAYDVEKETGKSDTTPKGLLTWLVRNGHLLDVVDGMIQYGVNPKLKITETLKVVAPDWIELIEYVNRKDDEAPSPSVVEIWKKTAGGAAFTASENAKPKSRYALIRTQERNLGKDGLTGQKRGSTLASAYALWSAHICKNWINTQKKIKPMDRFTEGHYEGYNGHSVYNRYNTIKITGGKYWTLRKFDVNESSNSPMRFSDYERILFNDNVRKTLPDEKSPAGRAQLTSILNQVEKMVTNGWSMQIQELSKFVFPEKDKKDKKSKKQADQEKYDESNAIMQVMMGMINDEDECERDPAAQLKKLRTFADEYANNAAKFIHSRSTEGQERQKKIKGKWPGVKSLDELDYADGTFEKYSPSTVKARRRCLGNNEKDDFGNEAAIMEIDFDGEDEDDGMLIDDVIDLLSEEDIKFEVEHQTEFDATVAVAASDETEFVDLFDGDAEEAKDDILQLRSEWQCKFDQDQSTEVIKCYRIIPRKAATTHKRKAPPEDLTGGKNKAARKEQMPTPKTVRPKSLMVVKPGIMNLDLMDPNVVKAWCNTHIGEVEKYRDSQDYNVGGLDEQLMADRYGTMLNIMVIGTVKEKWGECFEGKPPSRKREMIRHLANFLANRKEDD